MPYCTWSFPQMNIHAKKKNIIVEAYLQGTKVKKKENSVMPIYI